MAADNVLYSYRLKGYWYVRSTFRLIIHFVSRADIGQPKDFLRGTMLYLAGIGSRICPDEDPRLADGDGIIGNVLIHPSAKIGKDCLIGPDVTIGSNCVVRDGVRISNSAIMEDVKIGEHSYVNGSIVGWQSVIARWVRQNIF